MLALKQGRMLGTNGRPGYLHITSMDKLAWTVYWRDVEQQSVSKHELVELIRQKKVEELDAAEKNTLHVPPPSRQQLRTVQAYVEMVRVETPGIQTTRRFEVCSKSMLAFFSFSQLPCALC